jgi:ribosomal protein S18 acetylase RimI-like enzyme
MVRRFLEAEAVAELAEMLQLPASLADSGLAIRRSVVFDTPFLRALFASARSDAALLATLPASQREPFLDDQFRLQDKHYREHYAGADFLIIEQGGKPVGRLVLDRSTSRWHIVDIALVPVQRGRGTGRALLQAILDAASKAGVTGVGLNVESDNRARGLYARLGFVEIGNAGFRIAMFWTAVS